MEQVGQGYGYILYRTQLNAAQSGTLKIDEVHSYAQIYLDGVLQGTVDRRLDQSSIELHSAHAGSRLDILVENTGRVNFGRQFPHETAGITHQVTLAGATLAGWNIYTLPMGDLKAQTYKAESCSGPCFYRGTFHVDQPADTFPADTIIDTRNLAKGEVFVNGRPLGRFWKIGPQGTLYLPGPWLKPGDNQIVIFDLEGRGTPTVPFLDHAELDWRGK
jgi:beta-galactosidase